MFKMIVVFFALVNGEPTPVIKALVTEDFPTMEACESVSKEAMTQLRSRAEEATKETLIGAGYKCVPADEIPITPTKKKPKGEMI